MSDPKRQAVANAISLAVRELVGETAAQYVYDRILDCLEDEDDSTVTTLGTDMLEHSAQLLFNLENKDDTEIN